MSTSGDGQGREVSDTDAAAPNPFVQTVRSYFGGGRGPLTQARKQWLALALKVSFTAALLLALGVWAIIYFGGL